MALLGMTPGGEAQPMPFNVTQAAPAQAQAMPFSPENAPAPQLQQMGGAPVRVASADPNDVNPVLMALARRAGAAPQGAGMAQGGAMPPQAAPAPQQVAQAPQAPQGAQQGAAGLSQGQLIQALQSGRLSPAGQRVVQSLIERNFQLQDMEAKRAAEAADPMRQLELEKLQLEVEGIRNPMPQPTGDMREYEYAKSQGFPGTFQDYQIALKEAGRPSTSVNIDQKAQGALEKTLGEQVGKTFASMYDEGTQAGQDIYQLDRLRGLLQQSGSGLGPALASAAAGFGIKLTDGADAGQAANAIISYLVPRMRVPGTGASSDRDVSLFQKALPSLLNTPEGNAMILETMQGLAEYKRAQGDIAGMVVMGEIDPKEATKMIRGLPDPFARFKSVQQQGVQAGAPQPSVVDGMTATNPQTGQKIIFRNGQWVPM
jgi:flagellar protein FlgJ